MSRPPAFSHGHLDCSLREVLTLLLAGETGCVRRRMSGRAKGGEEAPWTGNILLFAVADGELCLIRLMKIDTLLFAVFAC